MKILCFFSLGETHNVGNDLSMLIWRKAGSLIQRRRQLNYSSSTDNRSWAFAIFRSFYNHALSVGINIDILATSGNDSTTLWCYLRCISAKCSHFFNKFPIEPLVLVWFTNRIKPSSGQISIDPDFQKMQTTFEYRSWQFRKQWVLTLLLISNFKNLFSGNGFPFRSILYSLYVSLKI